ncbi:uncharacterized protein LOC127262487 [Andrographis paniculata]|uniref:uncharacterized protein LOC127262487 n=1 Tax=Andrographis paniculata TaxID=175694 RepID=UPI0021E7EF08|nr:uncharacterized protein LOC127262487 [Andrographis paniculata]
MESQRDCKPPKLKTLDGIISPMINLANSRRYSSIFDPYGSDSSNSPSPLMTYLRSADPVTSIDSPPVFITPIKVEEDVIVMDGIPVPKSNRGGGGGGGEPRMRFPATSSNSITGGRSNSSSSSLATGCSNRGVATDNIKSHNKHRLCRFWESTGICQFGTECQFAHGKEELRPPRSSGKPKFEIFKLTGNSEGLSSSSYGTKYTPISQARPEEESTMSLRTGMAFPKPQQQPQPAVGTNKDSTPPKPKSDWSPLDDGISFKLLRAGSSEEKSPSKEDLDSYIEKVLYGGNNSRKRLPVFREICRD